MALSGFLKHFRVYCPFLPKVARIGQCQRRMGISAGTDELMAAAVDRLWVLMTLSD